MEKSFDPKTILIYSGGEIIGDGLIKLPYVYALRRAYPKAHITWYSGRGTTVFNSLLKPLVENTLDEIVENQGVGWSFKEVLKNPLPGKHYDLIVDTQKWACVPCTLKRVSHKVFLSHAWKGVFSNTPKVWFKKPPRHDVKRIFDLTSSAGIPLELKIQAPPIPKDYHGIIKKLLPEGRSYVGLAPGAGNMAKGQTKCWPLENYISLAKSQLEKGRTPVFILGPDEQEMVSDLKREVPEALFPLQDKEAPKSPIFTISLAQKLNVSVSNDSGAGHMCAVSGSPLISLFGPTNPQKLGPLINKGEVISANQFNSHLMKDIPLNVVENAVDKFF